MSSQQQKQQRQILKLTHTKSNFAKNKKKQSQYLTAIQIAESFPRVKNIIIPKSIAASCCQLLPNFT